MELASYNKKLVMINMQKHNFQVHTLTVDVGGGFAPQIHYFIF